MIDVLKIHSKSLRYIIGKLTEAWRTLISCGSSVNSRDGCRPLPTSMMAGILSLAAGFAFSIYFKWKFSQQVPLIASET